jgi:hypothetical protein
MDEEMQSQMIAGMGQQPGAPVESEAAPAVCIAPDGSGSFVVYMEGARPQSQPMDIDTALQQAKAMLVGETEAEASGLAEAEAMFQQGYKGARGINL